ncbi:MAG: hypothetical protein U0694_07205 [Anaerolineae bacterium]
MACIVHFGMLLEIQPGGYVADITPFHPLLVSVVWSILTDGILEEAWGCGTYLFLLLEKEQ